MRHTERTKEADRNIRVELGMRLWTVLTVSTSEIETKQSNHIVSAVCVSPGCCLHIITSDVSKSQPELTKKDRLKVNNSCREIIIFYHKHI